MLLQKQSGGVLIQHVQSNNSGKLKAAGSGNLVIYGPPPLPANYLPLFFDTMLYM
jgi:hypothetical protein